MAKFDDATILKRAKEICAKRGFSWDYGNRRSLDQDGRRQYLALAREQLLDEAETLEGAERSAPVV
jgi:hypothetical protein